MASTKKLTEEEINRRMLGRPIKLIPGTFLSIKKPAKWQCLNQNCCDEFIAPPRQIIHAGGGCPKCGKVGHLTESLIKERLLNRPLLLVSGTLIGSDKKATWKCLTNLEHPNWESSPSSILNSKSGCPVCSGKLPLTEQEIVKKIKGRKIELVKGSYVHSLRKATWQCLLNNSHPLWTSNVKSVLYGKSGCPKCSGNTPLSEQDVIAKLGDRKIQLVTGTLRGARGSSIWKCLQDDSHPVWKASAGSVLGGSNCPSCTGNERCSVDMIKRKIKDRPVDLLSTEITDGRKKALWGCLLNTQHENWLASPSSVLAGSGCPECAGNSKLSEDKIKIRLQDRPIKLIEGTFKSAKSHASWLCLSNKDHANWNAQVTSVLGGVGCPECAEYGYKENKSAYIYIMLIGNPLTPIGIKCGITNNHPTARQGQINRKTEEIITLDKHWYHADGKLIRSIETEIMKNFSHNNLGELLKDGATETFFYKDYDSIVSFIEERFSN